MLDRPSRDRDQPAGPTAAGCPSIEPILPASRLVRRRCRCGAVREYLLDQDKSYFEQLEAAGILNEPMHINEVNP